METSDCIVEGLYLGGIMAALNEKDLNDKGVTHILSIDESPLPPILTQKFNYKHVEALDLFDTDLLSFFPDTFVFIEQAKNAGGTVLVHCQAGMSRSATVVAAYLMQKMSLGRDEALELIKRSRPFIRPNEGFMEQLELFGSMGCEVVKTHKRYRTYKLSKLVDLFQHGQFGGSADYEIPSDIFIQSDFSSDGNDAYYKCRKCRLILFRQGAVTNHTPGAGESAFDWRGQGSSKHHLANMRSGGQESVETCSRSLFVDPMQWMKGKINTVSGKLHCPKCDIKLGSFVWYGEKCPCGAWVAPAFHIDTGKVDKIPFQTVAPQAHSSGVAVPLSGASATASPTSAPYPSSSLGIARPFSAATGDLHAQGHHQGRPLSQGPNFAAGHFGGSGGASQTSSSSGGRKPVAMVAAVSPRVAPSQDAQAATSSSSTTTSSSMEIDELSAAVGTSSLESTAAVRTTGVAHPQQFGGGAGVGDGNVCMDVDS